MNFYIVSIKIWFKGFREDSRKTVVYYFEPDKINVITGDSSTGKSSLLNIIDYLLLSDNPTIVENIINENVEFYGMKIFIDGNGYVLIRKAPHMETGSQDVYFENIEAYPEPYKETHKVGELNDVLTRIFNIPVRMEKIGNRNASITFRHFLPFNYLTEDIISSANVYFDIPFFISRSYDIFLDFALKYANGIKNFDVKGITAEIEAAKKELNKYQQKHLKIQEEERIYQEELGKIFEEALGLNLITEDNLFLREDANEMLKYVQCSISAYDKLIKDEEDTNKLGNLRKKRDDLRNKVNIYRSLIGEMDKQKSLGSRVEDSLLPIRFIRKHIDEVISSPDTLELLDMLENQLRQIKEVKQNPPVLPPDFINRYEELKRELKDCNNELNRLSKLRQTIGNPVWLNRALRIKYRLKYLKRPSTDKYQFAVEQEKVSKIEALETRLKQIRLLPHDIKDVLSKHINQYFHSKNGMVGSYQDTSMIYDESERRISLKKKGEEFPVRNIGSKSNYMFLHLCFFLGLHKSILENKSQQVGSFIFIDQPSIPYYADKGTLDNDDKKQLTKAFCLLNDFMKEIIVDEEGHFQIILIEHADESYWDKLEFFYTVAKFSKSGNGGLVPKSIYEK